ncbi:hypothetical protein SSIG_02858 [Streptomyces filamentosus NRRL 11379]|nr:hypothetical protein SSIG_02858 [Streptomyces filamentosus NRRL 11379]
MRELLVGRACTGGALRYAEGRVRKPRPGGACAGRACPGALAWGLARAGPLVLRSAASRTPRLGPHPGPLVGRGPAHRLRLAGTFEA